MEIFDLSIRFKAEEEPTVVELDQLLAGSAGHLKLSPHGTDPATGLTEFHITGIARFKKGLPDVRELVREIARQLNWQGFQGLVGDERIYAK